MRRWMILAGLLLAPISQASAQANPATREILASLYIAQYLKGTLTELPVEFVKGELQLRSATLFQLDLGYAFPRFDVPIPFCDGCAIRGNRIELHVALGQYAGRQTNAEIGAYAMLRTGQIGAATGLQANIAAGWGISHAFGTTGTEFGRTGVQGVDTYQTQLQVPIEVEW